MDKMSQGPFEDFFNADTAGVVQREVITYRIINGKLSKEVAVREYYTDGDYHDSITVSPLVER
jgi:hypothetical protein